VSSHPDGLTEIVSVAFDTLPVSVAILDAEGTVRWVNEAWESFGVDAGATPAEIGVGVNYFEAAADSDAYGEEAVRGLRAAIDGDDPTFSMEYPCHGPDTEQWFLMWAGGFEHSGTQYVVVAHFDVTDRTLAEQEVAESAAELSRQRDHLALLNQVVRHDIRNDVQLVLSHAEILEDAVPAADRHHLDRVLEQATHIIELTDAVRDLSAVIVEDTEPTLSAVNLGAVIQTEADKVQSAYETGGRTVTISGTDDIPFDVEVRANEMLSSVVGNVLSNAVIHNDSAEPRIDIAVDATEETATVTIADNGVGIPEADWQTVFGRGEMSIDSPGTGLGLYLVDQLIALYGGDVWVSDGDLGGTAFHLQFRRAD
jgi:signal transduction histidine kinase